jgi:hypothetical protein
MNLEIQGVSQQNRPLLEI